MPKEIVSVDGKKRDSIYCVFQERNYGSAQRNPWAMK